MPMMRFEGTFGNDYLTGTVHSEDRVGDFNVERVVFGMSEAQRS